MRDDYSMAADEVVDDLKELMESAPNDMMRKELQRIMKKVEEMDRRLVIVEQSSKSAHHRIDRMEGKEEERNA